MNGWKMRLIQRNVGAYVERFLPGMEKLFILTQIFRPQTLTDGLYCQIFEAKAGRKIIRTMNIMLRSERTELLK